VDDLEISDEEALTGGLFPVSTDGLAVDVNFRVEEEPLPVLFTGFSGLVLTLLAVDEVDFGLFERGVAFARLPAGTGFLGVDEAWLLGERPVFCEAVFLAGAAGLEISSGCPAC